MNHINTIYVDGLKLNISALGQFDDQSEREIMTYRPNTDPYLAVIFYPSVYTGQKKLSAKYLSVRGGGAGGGAATLALLLIAMEIATAARVGPNTTPGLARAGASLQVSVVC